MGLDSFKTEGPRTYKPDSSRRGSPKRNEIHLLSTMNGADYTFLDNKEVHKVHKVDDAMALSLPGDQLHFTCQDCGKVANSYQALIKSDFIEFADGEDALDCMESIFNDARQLDPSEYSNDGLDDEKVERMLSDSSGSDGDDSSSSKSGDNNDEDFNSGLGNFVS